MRRADRGVSFIITSGNITTLNKVEDAENTKRINDGLKPLVRPVNGGAMILKESLQNSVRTESCKRVKKDLLPIQLGLGCPAGPEKLAHHRRADYESGDYSIPMADAINGFNDLERLAVHQAQAHMWPEAADIFNAYYGMPSLCMYVPLP